MKEKVGGGLHTKSYGYGRTKPAGKAFVVWKAPGVLTGVFPYSAISEHFHGFK
jgi:hypothetical protein